MMDALARWLGADTRGELIWIAVGLGGQILFMMRFMLQWLASEKARRSVVPVSFWWLSIFGAAVLLAYAIHRRDPVFILGQSLGFFIYARNIYFIRAERRAELAPNGAPPDAMPDPLPGPVPDPDPGPMPGPASRRARDGGDAV